MLNQANWCHMKIKQLTHLICHYQFFLFSAVIKIGLMCRVFANGSGDWGSIPGRVIPKTQKMVLDGGFGLHCMDQG